MNRNTSNIRPILFTVALASMVATGLLIGQPRSARETERFATSAKVQAPQTQRESSVDRKVHSPKYPPNDLPDGAVSIQIGDRVWNAKELKRLSNRQKWRLMWGESGPEDESPYRVYGRVL